MEELEAKGTAQNRKVYARHGVQEPMFGVSFANLKALAKKIGKHRELAQQLWETGNHDARILATMVADPEDLGSKTLDAWVKELDNYVISDAFSSLVGKTKFGRKKGERWTKSKSDFVGQVGWNLIGGTALYRKDIDPAYLRDQLGTIEGEIHSRKNRTKHAMNMALCAIGIGCPSLQKEAIAVAKRIGQVEVDHGETGCQTPDAAAYIKRAAARKKKGPCSKLPASCARKLI
jgi:3-methyladenine DNA glycosylase AlkD